MVSIAKQPAIIRLQQLGYIGGGISLVISALISEPYLHRLNVYIVVVAITVGMLMVESTLFSVLYRALISKKSRLTQWSKKNRFLALIVIVFAFVWTLMLFEISKGVYFAVFSNKV